jgi:hypothetical protein
MLGHGYPQFTPAQLPITINWPDIRVAERRAGHGSRSPHPLAVALAEQSHYVSGRVNEAAVVLIDFEGREARFAPCEPLRAYLERWQRSQPLEPARFVLELATGNERPG